MNDETPIPEVDTPPASPAQPAPEPEEDKPNYGSAITALAKHKAGLIEAAQVSVKEAQKHLAREANEVDQAIKHLYNASPLAPAEAPKKDIKLNVEDELEKILGRLSPRRLKEIDTAYRTIPESIVSGVISIPEAGGKVVFKRTTYDSNTIITKIEREEEV